MGDEYWYPLYEKMVELDIPALVHSSGCRNLRESYSGHFITEESIAILSLCSSRVFEDFPKLKLIICHGGGSVPYQIGRWRSTRISQQTEIKESFDVSLRRLNFDTNLYNQESLDFLFRMVGTERCMFGTENPGTGSAIDPETGRWMDDIKPMIEAIPWMTVQDKKNVFEDVAMKIFPRFKVNAAV
jgi:4-oxalmesaconate hydratase